MVVPVFYADLTCMQGMELEPRTCTEGQGTSRDISGHGDFAVSSALLHVEGSDDLDHERDMILAIHAAIPDLIGDTNRHVIRLAAAASWP